MDSEKCDVFICGGGPTGLLMAYQLAYMGIQTCIIERFDKQNGPMYGRACTLFPRTIEMLEQVDLLDEMSQMGVVARTSFTFDKNGERNPDRGYQAVFERPAGNSFHDYCLNLRLKYSEQIFTNAYQRLGNQVLIGWTLTGLDVDEHAPDGYHVTSTIQKIGSDTTRRVKRFEAELAQKGPPSNGEPSKFVVGADGAHSAVRTLAGIEMDEEPSPFNWIRLDGIIKTNLPDARIGMGFIESAKHGSTLWVPLDHGRSRVGLSIPPHKYKGKPTEEEARAAVVEALAPFEAEIVQLDWWTCYSIKQGIASNFFVKNRILLVGEACHVHSSGAAQGMNVGVHDVTGLAWKLAGVLRGYFHPEILTTYETERRPVAQHLLHLDKVISSLASGVIPGDMASEAADPNQLLERVFSESMDFNIGLGVRYEANMLNAQPTAGMIKLGSRAPDVLVYPPGPRVPMRLFQLTKNIGAFYLIVFTGTPYRTSESLKALRSYVDDPSESFVSRLHPGAFKFLTIMAGWAPQANEELGVSCFGKAYFDVDSSAHIKYGIDPKAGAVVVLRPDGILGFATELERGKNLSSYFSRFAASKPAVNGVK